MKYSFDDDLKIPNWLIFTEEAQKIENGKSYRLCYNHYLTQKKSSGRNL